MRFNCGPSANEKLTEMNRDRNKWYRWFAWYPVRTVDYDCRWLEFVEWKASFYFTAFGMVWGSDTRWYRSIK